MTALPYIVDGTAENFPRLVLENSQRGPVVVNFWSPHAGPCLVVMPRLIRVASEYGGRLLVVMLNSDQHGELTRRLGVHALPLLQVFRNGVEVDRLQGVESESGLRVFLDKYASRSAAVVRAYESGAIGKAVGLAAKDALARPEDPDTALRVAKLLVLDGRASEAFALLDALPVALRAAGEVCALHAHLALLAAMTSEDDGAQRGRTDQDAEGLFVAAAQALHTDDYEMACARLIESARCDPHFRDGLARHAAHALVALPMADDVRTRLRNMLSDLG
ncbi:MAG TPA: thioredoxin domain-containing protein [Acidiferrobacter sp.]|nr:thioredoxin domain-containing protein [Acidiferrobacter sp.]